MDAGSSGEDIDQFQLLEEKIDSLINLVAELKKEKESSSRELQIQKGEVADLTERLQKLEVAKDTAKHRVATLLNKIEQIGI